MTEKATERTPRGGYGRGRGNQGGSNRGRESSRQSSRQSLENPSSSNHDKRVAYSQEDNSNYKENEVDHIESKKGKNLMFRRVLIKQPAPYEPKHRRALFRIRYKILGKFCKVVAESGSIDNIISKEVVENLKLAKVPHVNP